MKRKPFKMRSGNNIPFKIMGVSPAKKDGPGFPTGLIKKKPKKKKDFEPAYPGAEYSQKEIDAMTEAEKIAKIDGYEPKADKKKSPNKASQQAGAIIRRERHMI
tara:strand:+ start:130 stop:441 length:312 start_codon:yes stop_codon:yes gene_type:complete